MQAACRADPCFWRRGADVGVARPGLRPTSSGRCYMPDAAGLSGRQACQRLTPSSSSRR